METGWLSPAGDFYPCPVYDHIATAMDILEKANHPGAYRTPDSVLLALGWVQITISMLFHKEQRVYWERHLTPAQIRFLKPYFSEENPLPMDSNAIIRWSKALDEQ